jgi:hypothetical protein
MRAKVMAFKGNTLWDQELRYMYDKPVEQRNHFNCYTLYRFLIIKIGNEAE